MLYGFFMYWVNNFDDITFEYDNYFIAIIIGIILFLMLLIKFSKCNFRLNIYNLRSYKIKSLCIEMEDVTKEEIKKR